jgi:hypothetical protein
MIKSEKVFLKRMGNKNLKYYSVLQRYKVKRYNPNRSSTLKK